MTSTEQQRVEEIAGPKCFTYCGDDKCDCPANPAHSLLGYIAPALPVLANMCRTAGLTAGADKADEMNSALRTHLQEQAP